LPDLRELVEFGLPVARQVPPGSTAFDAFPSRLMAEQPVEGIHLPFVRIKATQRTGDGQAGLYRLEGFPVVDDELHPTARLSLVHAVVWRQTERNEAQAR